MNSINIKQSRALINRLAYLKRTNKDEYIKYKKKIDDDKMNSLMNNVEIVNNNNDNNNKTDNIPNNKPFHIPNNKTDNIPNNKTDNIPDDETSYYLNFYNQPNIKNLNNIKHLLNNLLSDDEYIKVLEVLILNKDVYEPYKYIHNLKMVLIDGYNDIINELNETINELNET
jgi:hypothetical protein